MDENELKRIEKEAIEQMFRVCFTDDPEYTHIQADEILCDALSELGFDELVHLYETVDKWYS